MNRAGHIHNPTGRGPDVNSTNPALNTVPIREKEIRGSGGSLEPPGPLLTHLHTVYMAYS
jgi:hypothetical protein